MVVPCTVVFSVILLLQVQFNSWHCKICILSLIVNTFEKEIQKKMRIRSFTVLFYRDFYTTGNQVRSISSQLERVFEEKSHVQSELSLKNSEMTMLKTNEKRLEVGDS